MSVKLLFAAAIFISYGVQFYVPAIILIPFIEKKLGPQDAVLKNCLIRTAFVIGTCKYTTTKNLLFCFSVGIKKIYIKVL